MPDFRLDRALSIGVMKAQAGLDLVESRQAVPILMYHGIRQGACKRHPYFETNTSPQIFASHMRYLSQNGYRSIGLEEAAHADAASDKGERKVAITFDDGYLDFLTHALPVLVKYGFHATVFVVSSFAQNPNGGFGGEKYLSWREIHEVIGMGNVIGSHTVSHPKLRSVSDDRLVREITGSKRDIEQETGRSVDSFAYPYAFPGQDRKFLSSLRCLLAQSGYGFGVCTSIGTVKSRTDRYFMPRIPMNTHDDLLLFEAKLSGAYDWLGVAQSVRKQFGKKTTAPDPAGLSCA